MNVLANPQGLNSYAYGNGNPITNSDPSGECVDGVTTGLCVAAWVALTSIAGGAIMTGVGAYNEDENMTETGLGLMDAGSMLGGSATIRSSNTASFARTSDSDYSKEATRAAVITENRINGASRESATLSDLKAQYPDADIVKQPYLRNADGSIAKDARTGMARRLDFAVVKGGKVLDRIEVTR